MLRYAKYAALFVTIQFIPFLVSATSELRFEKLFLPVSPINLHIYQGGLAETKLTPDAINGINLFEGISIRPHSEAFALGKFQFAPGTMAYLIRLPGCYENSNNIALLLVDSKSGKAIALQENVAYHCGDGGITVEIEAWLMDLNADGFLDIVTKTLFTDSEKLIDYMAEGQKPGKVRPEVECSPPVTKVFLYSPEQESFSSQEQYDNSLTRALKMKLGKYPEKTKHCKG